MTAEKQESLGVQPVTVLWESVLMIPLVGAVDSKRAQYLMESMLVKIQETGARMIILDILGVAAVDSKVASHMLKIAQASKLMGADCIISGISPQVAQGLVSLGVDLGAVITVASLNNALALAFDRLGLEVVAKKKAAAK